MPPDASPPAARAPKKVLLIDDSVLYAESWRAVLLSRYGEKIAFEAYQDPLKAIPHLAPDVDLLLLDLEMPVLDGRKIAALAQERGIPPRRIVVVSARDADALHRIFPSGTCLAVINKSEPAQQEAFLMILDSVMRR